MKTKAAAYDVSFDGSFLDSKGRKVFYKIGDSHYGVKSSHHGTVEKMDRWMTYWVEENGELGNAETISAYDDADVMTNITPDIAKTFWEERQK